MDVKILIYTLPRELEKNIEKWAVDYGYKLQGPVTVGINSSGSTIYVATMVKEKDA